jgi:ABC-2 type transport system permease protein
MLKIKHVPEQLLDVTVTPVLFLLMFTYLFGGAVAGSAPLVGAVVGDSVRYAIAAVVVLVLGFIMGFDAEGGPLGVLAAVALVVWFTFGLSWVFTTIGLVLRAPNAVLNTGFMLLFPLVFLSNIFVEPSTLPGWLEAFVDVNPISHLVTAVRELMAGTSEFGDVALVIGEAALLTAIFAPLTVRLYRKG